MKKQKYVVLFILVMEEGHSRYRQCSMRIRACEECAFDMTQKILRIRYEGRIWGITEILPADEVDE